MSRLIKIYTVCKFTFFVSLVLKELILFNGNILAVTDYGFKYSPTRLVKYNALGVLNRIKMVCM